MVKGNKNSRLTFFKKSNIFVLAWSFILKVNIFVIILNNWKMENTLPDESNDNYLFGNHLFSKFNH